MQEPGSRHSSHSTVGHLDFHRLSTPENSQASSFSTLITPPASYELSVSDVFSVSNASSVNDFVWPWLEAEAEEILRGSNLHTIQLLCRYRIYRDSSVLASILRSRQIPILNAFLLRLSVGVYNRNDVDKMALDQKVHEILERLLPPVPPANPRRDLVSSALLLEPDACCLTSKLYEESSVRFQKITFVDYVREALYPDETVEPIVNFIDWHDSLFNAISSRLEEFPEEAVKYAQVEQQLHEGSPLRWAVFESLRQTYPYPPDLVMAPEPDLGFIYDPLRDLFHDQGRNLVDTLKKLVVLEVRFQQWYSPKEEINWAQSFDTNTAFFDSISTLTPEDLADSLTENDEAAFEDLSPRDIARGDSKFQSLHIRWNKLCQEVQETIAGDQGLGPPLADLAKELYTRHNYYSLTAILQALREASSDEARLSPLFDLIQTDQNYVTYRDANRITPGLPFLPPHVQQLKQNKKQALCEVHSFLLRQPALAQKQEQGGKKREDLGSKRSWTAWTWAKIKSWFSCSAVKRIKESGDVC